MIKFIFFILNIVGIFSQPTMVYLINRHGVREARDTSVYEGGALLLNSAYERLYTKGVHIRQIYPIISQKYNPIDLRVNSSGWERTITTASGIVAGIYGQNDTRQIPVYSSPPFIDWTLYNYDKCPQFDQRVQEFQASVEWQDKEKMYQNLTQYLNDLLKPKTKITLANIYSTWDLYWIQRNRPEITISIPQIDDLIYIQLTGATYWVGTTKYSQKISGEYLGATLRTAVKYRMDMAIKDDKVFGHKMFISSTHYPTQLNFLASLGYNGMVSKMIPDYNSVIAVELYKKATFPSGWSVKLKYWDGELSSHIPIVMRWCQEGSDCEIDYTEFWSQYKDVNLLEWCDKCKSTMMLCVGAQSEVVIQNSTTNVINMRESNLVQIGLSVTILVFVIMNFMMIVVRFFKKQNHDHHEQINIV